MLALEGPGCAGVPEICPVAAIKLNPIGNWPEVMLHVYGGTPPVAWRTCD